ncbi:MAG: DUF86 domain-containing protein [Candidatus Pacebacteria bacterium]|nr:DUF86 domain-containing protein [Candidatus Paceibacterota bacterium]
MNQSPRLSDYLDHMIKAVEKIERYTTDMGEVDFLGNEQVQDAVIRNFEILGEAANNIFSGHRQFAELHNEIPWLQIYGMRNQLSHAYHRVDLSILWKTIESDLFDLYEKLELAKLNLKS